MHHRTMFQKQVITETLRSVMYNDNGRSANEYDGHFFNCIFLHTKEISQNKFLFYR